MAATGVVVARRRRNQTEYDADELRARLHDRLAEVPRPPAPGSPPAVSTLLAPRPQIAWRVATVADVVEETAGAVTLVFDAPGWPGHVAGQHVDVRLTAEDGYQTQRSYSIASDRRTGGWR